MASDLNLSKFNEIYNQTYLDTLKYVVIKCHNINDVNDIMQETYFELWKILNKKEITDANLKSFLWGIANNKIKKHYSLLQRIKAISLEDENTEGIPLKDTVASSININDLVIKKDDWDNIWSYLKQKKNQDITKIFYLYYQSDVSLKEIASLLNVNISYVKHLLYRTLHELQNKFGKGGNR